MAIFHVTFTIHASHTKPCDGTGDFVFEGDPPTTLDEAVAFKDKLKNEARVSAQQADPKDDRTVSITSISRLDA
jgi:hypothetical protein